MYVAKDMPTDNLESTLAHEVVHALQDQHFGIGGHSQVREQRATCVAAMHAVVEGDATSAMFDEMIAAKYGADALKSKNATHVIPDRDPEQMLEEELRRQDEALEDRERAALPRGRPSRAVRRRVCASSMACGAAADRSAEGGRPGVGASTRHDRAASSPREIRRERARDRGAGRHGQHARRMVQEDLRRGCSASRAVGIAFAEWMDVKSAKKAAAGWGGDHVTLFENGDKHAGDVAHRLRQRRRRRARPTATSRSAGRARSARPSLQQVGNEKDPKSESLQVWGALPGRARIGGRSEEGPKDGAKKPEKAGPAPLPMLPDAGTGQGTVKLNGCRAVKHAGSAVTLLTGVPCNAVVAWAAEVGK